MTLTIVGTRAITGGVDTHADVHVAAALDSIGGLLGVREFPLPRPGRPACWAGRGSGVNGAPQARPAQRDAKHR